MKNLLLALPFCCLVACADAPGQRTDANEVTAATVPASPTNSPLDISEERVMPQDQIEHTAENNPELIEAENVPQPVIADEKAGKVIRVQPRAQSNTTPERDAVKAPTTTRVAPSAEPASTAATPPPAPSTSPAPAAAPAKETTPATAQAPDHGAWNDLLGKYVDGNGNVNYAGLKNNEAALDAYLVTLSGNAPAAAWSRNEKLAYWINAYNAHTVKLILKNYPVKSITDLHGGKPWDVKWINIGGKTYSLNQIEHDVIRPTFKEPRIHFAVNCAAASCPPLPNKAFTAANLNGLLEARTRNFIRSGKYNTISADAVRVSKIFDWYGEDFGDLRTYLNKYAATQIPAGTEIGFQEYNWALNQ